MNTYTISVSHLTGQNKISIVLWHHSGNTTHSSTGRNTIWGPVSSSLSVSYEPPPCCGPSTYSSSVWWDDCQRTFLDKQKVLLERGGSKDEDRRSHRGAETHRSSPSWLWRSRWDLWSWQSRSLWSFLCAYLSPPDDQWECLSVTNKFSHTWTNQWISEEE